MIWTRQPLKYDGAIYRLPLPADQGTGLGKPLKLINRPVRDRIPIWLAALGQNNVTLAAEIADGWLPAFFVPDKAGEAFGDALAAGCAHRDPALGPLEIGAGGTLAIIDDADEATRLLDRARPVFALYIGGMGAPGRNFYNALVARYGWEKEAAVLQRLYLEGHKAEAEAAVPAELLEKTALVGPAGYVAERIAAYREAGVTVLTVRPGGGDPVRLVERVKEMTA